MKNFKDTVYSIFLGEDVMPPATPPRRGIGDDTDRREGRLPAKEPAPKGYTQEEWDKITDEYDEDMKRIDQEAQQKAQQEIKDTSVTSGGVERSLTAAEAQKAANTAKVPNPFGDSSRPDDSIYDKDGNKIGLSPNAAARFNQSQQNGGPFDAISRGQFIDAEHEGKLFNHMTGSWVQGPPRVGGGASTGNRGNSGRSEGNDPYGDKARQAMLDALPVRTPQEKEAEAQRAAKNMGDIIRQIEAQKEKESTPQGRRQLDTEKRKGQGLEARSEADFLAMEARRQKQIEQDNENKEFADSPEGKAAKFARSKGRSKGSTVQGRKQADEDYRLEQERWAGKAPTPRGVGGQGQGGQGQGGQGQGGQGQGGQGQGGQGQGFGQSTPTPKGDPIKGPGSGMGGNVDSSGGSSPSGNDLPQREGGGGLDSNGNAIPGNQNGEPKLDKDGNVIVSRNGTPSSSPGATRPTSSEPRLTGTQPGAFSRELTADSNNTTSSNSSSAITANRQKSGRAGEAAALAAFAAQRNNRPLGAAAMQTAGYSYNKALTFFAEQLKRKYIEEEVVNPENQPMSKSEISHRNKIRGKSPAKDARAIKGSDTKENAEYRLATYITMRGRKGKKKENK